MTTYAMYQVGERSGAPCFHGDDREQKEAEYLKGVLGPEYLSGSLEALFWCVGDRCLADDVDHLEWGFFADQWVGVGVRAVSDSDEVVEQLWTEGDNFALAVARTIERLREKGIIVERTEEVEEDAIDD